MRCGVTMLCVVLGLAIVGTLPAGARPGAVTAIVPAAAGQRGGAAGMPASELKAAIPSASNPHIVALAEGCVGSAMATLGLPGAALAERRDGWPLVAQASGLADRATGRRVDHATALFREASIARLFIHVPACEEFEAGRLDVDADISRHPDCRVEGPGGARITMRHLPAHSAGFEERMNGVFRLDPALAPAERLAARIPPRVRPRRHDRRFRLWRRGGGAQRRAQPGRSIPDPARAPHGQAAGLDPLKRRAGPHAGPAGRACPGLSPRLGHPVRLPGD